MRVPWRRDTRLGTPPTAFVLLGTEAVRERLMLLDRAHRVDLREAMLLATLRSAGDVIEEMRAASDEMIHIAVYPMNFESELRKLSFRLERARVGIGECQLRLTRPMQDGQ